MAAPSPSAAPSTASTATSENTQPQAPSYFGASADNITPAVPVPGQRSFFNLGGTEEFFEDPLKLGPFRIVPHANYRFNYSTAVLRTPGRTEATAQHDISPGVTLQSPHVALDYTPTMTYYTKGTFSDTLAHAMSARGNFGYGDWRFGIFYGLAMGSRPLLETATQTAYENHSVGANASYLYSEKTSFDLSANYQRQQSAEFNSSQTWSSMNWANHRITDQITLGAGFGGGFTDVETGSDMTFQQIQGRVRWAPGPKLTVSANGGIEIRQFLAGTGANDRINPIFGFSSTYDLLENTTLFLRASRSVNTSLIQDRITESTEMAGGVRQRFFGWLRGTLTGGVRQTDYQSSQVFSSGGRTDDVTFIATSLGTTLFKKANISVSYSHTDNQSTLAGYSYDNDQISVQLGYRF